MALQAWADLWNANGPILQGKIPQRICIKLSHPTYLGHVIAWKNVVFFAGCLKVALTQ